MRIHSFGLFPLRVILFPQAVLLTGLVLLSPAAHATVTYGGTGDYAPPQYPGYFYIGYNGQGTLVINNALGTTTTVTTTTAAYLGVNAGDTGTVTVDGSGGGSGALWSVSGPLYNGWNGAGSVTVENGGILKLTGSQTNGFATESSGATSILDVESGGQVQATAGIQTGETTITVSGPGSSLTTPSLLFELGSQTVTISNGANVSVTTLTTNGTLALTVDNATLTSSGSGAGVQMHGNGGSIQAIDGAQVTSVNDLIDSTSSASSPGTLLISGANTNGVKTLWSTGIMDVGSNGTGAVTVADGATLQGNYIQLADNNVGTPSGTLNIGNGSAPGIIDMSYIVGGITGYNVGTATVNFDHNSSNYYFTTTGTSSGTAVDIDGITQVKVTSGTTTITSNNSTYTGGTTINGGTFLVDNTSGSGTGTGNVVVNAGGTLGGKGTLAPTGTNSVTVSGNLSPGDTASGGTTGTLKFDLSSGTHLTFNSGATLTLNLVGGGTSDEVSFTSAASAGTEWLAGAGKLTLVLNLSGTNPYAQTYDIFNNAIANLTTGQFTVANITGYNSAAYTAVFSQSGNNYDLSFSPIGTPEPSTNVLLLLGGLGLGVALYRRKSARR